MKCAYTGGQVRHDNPGGNIQVMADSKRARVSVEHDDPFVGRRDVILEGDSWAVDAIIARLRT